MAARRRDDPPAAAAGPATDGLPSLRTVVQTHGLQPKRSLGQNFLFDLNLTRRIARAAGPLHEATVIEVGPGPGGLTRALLAEGAACVIAVERDARCLAALAEIDAHYPGRLHVVEADALACDLGALARTYGGGARVRIVANLPYNIGTALLTNWLETTPWPPWFDRLVLMFQREVADRIVADVSKGKAYGRLSVLCGWRTQARILFDVAPSAFVPPPQVTSAVVELAPRAEPLACEPRLLSAVTAAAFGQRRKMLRQSLKGLAANAAVDPSHLLEASGIDPTARAEQIEVAGFAALARAYAHALEAS